MSARLLRVFVLVLFVVFSSGCVATTESAEIAQAEILKNPDYAQRIDFFKTHQALIQDVVERTTSPELDAIGEFYKGCAVGAPLEQGFTYLTAGDSGCVIIIAREEDSKFPLWESSINQEKDFAFFRRDEGFIFFKMREEAVSEEYATAVLFHEAVHAVWNNNCGVGDFACRGADEALAYGIEFMVVDHFATRNPNYRSYLESNLEALTSDFEAGNITLPNYQDSPEYGKIRSFLRSESEYQDKMWLTVLWLRKHHLAFERAYGPETGFIVFATFLSYMYQNGYM